MHRFSNEVAVLAPVKKGSRYGAAPFRGNPVNPVIVLAIQQYGYQWLNLPLFNERDEAGLQLSREIKTDEQYPNRLAGVFLTQFYKVGQFLNTGLAPGGPEIHDVSGVIIQSQ